jgi:putative ABC transport system substrate-binding protein
MSPFMFMFPPNFCSVNLKSAIRNSQAAILVGSLLFALSFCTVILVSAMFIFMFSRGAQAAEAKVDHLGVVHLGGPFSTMIEGLRDGLAQSGLQEGKQFVLTIQDTKGDQKTLEEAVRKFEQEKVRLIYAVTTPVVAAAIKGTKDVLIVFSVGSDPVAAGFVQSFAKPGGRLTGVHYLVRDLTGKRLEILKEILPKLRIIVTFYDPGNRVASEAAKLGREEAKRLGLELIERHVTSVEQLRSALGALKAGDADAYFYTADPMVVSQAQLIIDTTRTKKLATMFHDQSLATQGALASYGQNYYEIGRVSAKYIQRVLSGTHPRDLKVETLDDVELAINLKTATALGITIPPQVLARANKVIK